MENYVNRNETNDGFQVSNRFSLLSENNMADMADTVNSVNNPDGQVVNRQDFSRSSIDDKFLALFDELKFIRTELVDSCRGISKVQTTVNKVSEKLGQVIDVTNQQTDFLKVIAYKSIDLEARSRRNNMIFRGFEEQNVENCAEIIRNFLETSLGIDTEYVYIARAHRLGKRSFPQNRGNGRTLIGRKVYIRPIIANFRDYGVIEDIMSNVGKLKGTNYSVDYDFPKEISDARKRIWPKLKDVRKQNPHAKPKIIYPAKLVVPNGIVLHDEFPDWNDVMSMSRVQTMSYISHSHLPMGGEQRQNQEARTERAASSTSTLDPEAAQDTSMDCSQSILSSNVEVVLTDPGANHPTYVQTGSQNAQTPIFQQNQQASILPQIQHAHTSSQNPQLTPTPQHNMQAAPIPHDTSAPPIIQQTPSLQQAATTPQQNQQASFPQQSNQTSIILPRQPTPATQQATASHLNQQTQQASILQQTDQMSTIHVSQQTPPLQQPFIISNGEDSNQQTNSSSQAETQAPPSQVTQNVNTETHTALSTQQTISSSSVHVNVPMSRQTANTQDEDRRTGVAHVSRTTSRSQRRSESCKPYKRQSESRGRVSKNRTPKTPASKNTGTTNDPQ